jgi:hypothetical protein
MFSTLGLHEKPDQSLNIEPTAAQLSNYLELEVRFFAELPDALRPGLRF